MPPFHPTGSHGVTGGMLDGTGLPGRVAPGHLDKTGTKIPLLHILHFARTGHDCPPILTVFTTSMKFIKISFRHLAGIFFQITPGPSSSLRRIGTNFEKEDSLFSSSTLKERANSAGPRPAEWPDNGPGQGEFRTAPCT